MADSLIKQTLDSLEDIDRDAIMDAFNRMEQHVIRLPDSKFLAVHAEGHPNLQAEETVNYWAYGTYKE